MNCWLIITIFDESPTIIPGIFATVTWPSGCQIKSTTCGNDIGTQPGANRAPFLCARGGGHVKNGHFLPFFQSWDIIPGIFATVTWRPGCQIKSTTCGNEIGTQPGANRAPFLCARGGEHVKNGHFLPFFQNWDIIPGIFATVTWPPGC